VLGSWCHEDARDISHHHPPLQLLTTRTLNPNRLQPLPLTPRIPASGPSGHPIQSAATLGFNTRPLSSRTFRITRSTLHHRRRRRRRRSHSIWLATSAGYTAAPSRPSSSIFPADHASTLHTSANGKRMRCETVRQRNCSAVRSQTSINIPPRLRSIHIGRKR
jgi:hypothetical protein